MLTAVKNRDSRWYKTQNSSFASLAWIPLQYAPLLISIAYIALFYTLRCRVPSTLIRTSLMGQRKLLNPHDTPLLLRAVGCLNPHSSSLFSKRLQGCRAPQSSFQSPVVFGQQSSLIPTSKDSGLPYPTAQPYHLLSVTSFRVPSAAVICLR